MTANSPSFSNIRLAVIHWFPLEQFPPAQNMLNFLASQPNNHILCCTTRRRLEAYRFDNSTIILKHSSFPERDLARIKRFLLLVWFPIWTFFRLFLFRPTHVFYIEPHSAPATFLYCLLFPATRLLCHYHEYREPSHFRKRGNFIARVGYQLERLSLFKKLEWISHTNLDRVRLFLADNPRVSETKVHELPNLPPANWQVNSERKPAKDVTCLRMVYVGAISLRDTYIEALVQWVESFSHDEIKLDLYINNIDTETLDFLEKHRSSNLTVHRYGVPYAQLPSVLPNYDIGLILYRCNSINYVYNAPNKLFEYLTCGLNVLYPKQMLGAAPYGRNNVRPWVIAVDFEQLSNLKIKELLCENLPEQSWITSCESVYEKLHIQIVSQHG
jgi:hypothetical protein